MTISELICHLQQIKCQHGDLRVLVGGVDGDLDLARTVKISQFDFILSVVEYEKFVSIE